jgi:membrane-bound serine protease (ClpP class)
MRRLVTTLFLLGALLGLTSPGRASAADTRPHVDVVEISGLIDPVQADFIHRTLADAQHGGAAAVVMRINSGGSVVSQARLDALASEISHSSVPVGVWVGPNGARAEGGAYTLVRAAAIAGIAGKTRVGHGASLGGGADPLAGQVIGGPQALEQKIVDLRADTLGDFVVALDGVDVGGGAKLSLPSHVVEERGRPPQRRPDFDVRFNKLSLTGTLMHTVASPSVAYLLLVIGLLLMVLEFFTAGIGVAAVVGAGCIVLSAYGLWVLPIRPFAVVLLVVAVLGFAIDVQAGSPRFWTAVGTVCLVLGTVLLMRGPSISWLGMVVGVGGTALFMVAGMPAMVRARFSTPTIGRESMVGEMGTALADVSPEGTVEIRGAQWRARTNRATPISAGQPIRVVAIDGLLLEVEPEAGGARDAHH